MRPAACSIKRDSDWADPGGGLFTDEAKSMRGAVKCRQQTPLGRCLDAEPQAEEGCECR